MSDLHLSTLEISNLKSSWNKINNKNDFYSLLYQNLIISNPKLKLIFNNDSSIIENHSIIFGDCFNFVMSNLRDLILLDEFLYQFVLENQRWSQMSTKYLEPMGNSLIETFKEELGNQFTSILELVWIKLYVFIANSLLTYEEEISIENNSHLNSTEDEEIEIPPLNIQRERRGSIISNNNNNNLLPPTPIEEKPIMKQNVLVSSNEREIKQPQILDSFNSIEIDLKSNTKYKGFRRSIDVASSPIQVAIPKTNSFSSNISSSLKSLLQDNSNINDVDSFITPISTPTKSKFDPRPKSKLRSSKPGSSASSINDKWSSSSLSSLSPEPETDDEEFKTPEISRRNSFEKPPSSLLDRVQHQQAQQQQVQQQQVQQQQQVHHHHVHQDLNAQSFGLKGLAPIVEDDSDSDSDSSKYSNGEKLSTTSSSTGQDSNSRSSSLSLYHQRSTSTSTASDDFNFLPPSIPKTVRKQSPPQQQQQAPKIGMLRSYSTTSLNSATPSSTTASIGFMNSSYILKNQMNKQGPSSIKSQPSTPRISAHPSTTSLNLQQPNPSFLKSTNSFQSAKSSAFDYNNNSNRSPSMTSSIPNGLNYKSIKIEPPKKQSFRQRLSSFFGSSSKSSISQVSTAPSSIRTIDYSKLPTKSNESIIPPKSINYSSHVRPQSVFSSSGGKTIKYGASTTDLTSMYSNESTTSGFSLFKKKNKNNDIKFVPPPTRHTRKGNKYNVKKVPYDIFA
ncbi:unnamed protein product [Candida verbasci]|uniref:Globin domain-containing protein n=1 Tax=Candida verbasci TaxID=1227364 RepID=A0A9W4X8U2_9ASCO|nr:unnamed protein product [Candida verbasci]